MHQFISVMKWAAMKKESEREAEQDEFQATHHFQRSVNSIIKARSGAPSCSAKGSGLVVGLVGKRCKFDIYTPVIELLDLHVQIKGPNDDFCSESISTTLTRRRSSAQTLSSDDLQRLKKSDVVGNGLQQQQEQRSEATDGDRIPFDYQCVGEGHFVVSYLPRSEGIHSISIRWKGLHIRGSPFQVTVADTLEKLNEESKNKLRHKRVSFGGDDAHKRLFLENGSNLHDEDADKENTEPMLPNVTAAVLNRSSKVHRSISTTAPAKLTKQATVTRRRVLKRVITKGGQEIVIHELGPLRAPPDRAVLIAADKQAWT